MRATVRFSFGNGFADTSWKLEAGNDYDSEFVNMVDEALDDLENDENRRWLDRLKEDIKAGLSSLGSQVCREMLIRYTCCAAQTVAPAALLFSCSAFGEGVLLRVGGEVDRPLELTRSDLAEMPRVRVGTPTQKDRSATEVWEGVPMIEILRMARAPVDDRMGGRNSAAYVLVTAADGYRAVYALAEIDPPYALERQVFVADTLNGDTLQGNFGNLRIVNKREGRFSRWIRQVIALDVHIAE